MLIALVPFLDCAALSAVAEASDLRVPIALFALALVGTLWSEAAWGARLYAIGPDR